MSAIVEFIEKNYRHFNAAALLDAARGYRDIIAEDGRMLLAMAGAMSTAELGISLAPMIRAGKVHAISCTGANLEEDLFNLVAHKHYRRIPNYRDLTPEDEKRLLDSHLNRVTDTCIPEEEAMRRIERVVAAEWRALDAAGERRFPHQVLYKIIREQMLAESYQIDTQDSWLVAAAEMDLPIFVPGWEDSTLGNFFAAACHRGVVKNPTTIRGGIEYMLELIDWYRRQAEDAKIGFFQIGGGIAGDFPICVVPLIRQDLQVEKLPVWSYFCQISDSTTSYGSYSGAVPNEKITWEKLDVETPKFVIESDATIVAPLIFRYVLDE